VSDSLQAFKLRSDLSLDELQGATVAFGPDALTFDVKAALVAGGGYVVTDDPLLAGVLRGTHVLEASDVPSDSLVLADVPGGGQPVATGHPAVFEPQSGLIDLQEYNTQAQAIHEPEPDTVEEAQNQGAPSTDAPPVEDAGTTGDTPPADTGDTPSTDRPQSRRSR